MVETILPLENRDRGRVRGREEEWERNRERVCVYVCMYWFERGFGLRGRDVCVSVCEWDRESVCVLCMCVCCVCCVWERGRFNILQIGWAAIILCGKYSLKDDAIARYGHEFTLISRSRIESLDHHDSAYFSDYKIASNVR